MKTLLLSGFLIVGIIVAPEIFASIVPLAVVGTILGHIKGKRSKPKWNRAAIERDQKSRRLSLLEF